MNSCHGRLLAQLENIKLGDSIAREGFLNEYQPFVAKVAMSICKRPLYWGQDDELSIGLIALNHALDKFQPEKGVPFLGFAQVVIQNKLKDFFKSNGKIQYESLWLESENDDFFSPGDNKAAWEDYQNRTIEDERQQEIEYLEELLSSYQIEFEDLVEAAPKHRDTRQTLITVGKTVLQNQDLLAYVRHKKQLPIKELCLITSVNRKTIERGRKYIIALIEILTRPEEFVYIRSYIHLD